MLRIALCDDNRDELSALEKHLLDYTRQRNAEIVWDAFESGVELLSRIAAGTVYHLIFLDIVMPLSTGIEVAREIFASNKVTQFVFLTASAEYAVDSYSVNALDYLIKPITAKGIERVFAKYKSRFAVEAPEGFVISDRKSTVRIAYHSLAYVEVMDHYLVYHVADGDTVRIRQSLSEIEEMLLERKNFIKPHRSYLVNLDYVTRVEASQLLLSVGDKIPVSKDKNKLISDAFLKHKLNKGDDRI